LNAVNDPLDAVNDSLDAVNDSLDAVNDSLDAVNDSLDAVNDSLDAVNDALDATATLTQGDCDAGILSGVPGRWTLADNAPGGSPATHAAPAATPRAG
jgi:ABC-type transporter Mla subunit MlaD